MEHSFLAVMEQFLQTVDLMDSTVLIPMKLIDLPVKELMPTTKSSTATTNVFLQNNMNMRAFYFMVKAMRIKLSFGYSDGNDESCVPLEREIQDSCQRLNQLALVTRYIKTIDAQSWAKPRAAFLPRTSKQARALFQSENNLPGALKKFVDEVESLEKSVLFPSLLKDHRVSEDMPQLNEEVQTLYDVFILLKKLKTELLSGSRNFELPDAKLQQKLSQLFQTFVQYTAMARNLAARYEEEVRCF